MKTKGQLVRAALVGAAALALAAGPAQVATAKATITLYGDGVGQARFGKPLPAALKALEASLGRPGTPSPVQVKGDCNIGSRLIWTTLTAYFRDGQLVGFSTTAAATRPAGSSPSALHLATSAGLSVGDPLPTAKRLYGNRLRTSATQGGSWSVTTARGTVDGYLTAEPSTTAAPRIATIEAGDVGCPALAP